MPNTGDGTAWDITSPADADFLEFGAMQIRDLRTGVGIRLSKEHVTLATSSAGGEHKAGSAKAFLGSSFPTLRPDAATALNADDAGRVFFKYLGTAGLYQLTLWDGTGWRDLQLTVDNFPDGSVPRDALSYGAAPPFVLYEDVKSAGTESGAISAGSWVKRTLNTASAGDDTLGSLASSVITLPAGTYRIEFWAPGYKCNRFQARLRDTTNGVTKMYGSTERSNSTTGTTARSHGFGEFTFTGDTDLELQQYNEASNATNDGGIAANHGTSEIYAQVKIERVA